MLIWLIRHGLTELGEQKRYQGAVDTPLSAAGLAALCPCGAHPDLVITSGMRRAEQTADVLFPGRPHTVIPDLREMDFGVFEGRGYWEMAEDASYRAWVDGGCEGRCPGGEDRREFCDRVCAAFAAAVDRALTDRVDRLAAVAHGGTQMAVLERWGDPPREYYRWQTAPGCGWVLDKTDWPRRLRVTDGISCVKD